MSAILITRREIRVDAILDILDEDRRRKLDVITQLIAELEADPDPAIKIEVVDVERQISKKRMPRLPARQREVVRIVRPQQIPAQRDPGNARASRAATQRAKEVLECFEGDEWISLKDLTAMLGRSERHVRETMKMLHEAGLFREEGRADELTHHMVPHFQVVKRRLNRLVSTMPDDVKHELDQRMAANEAAAEETEIVNVSDLLGEASPAPVDDLGLDLLETDIPDIDADMAIVDL